MRHGQSTGGQWARWQAVRAAYTRRQRRAAVRRWAGRLVPAVLVLAVLGVAAAATAGG